MKVYLLALISNTQQKPIILSKSFYKLLFVQLDTMHKWSIERSKYMKTKILHTCPDVALN